MPKPKGVLSAQELRAERLSSVTHTLALSIVILLFCPDWANYNFVRWYG